MFEQGIVSTSSTSTAVMVAYNLTNLIFYGIIIGIICAVVIISIKGR